jgi:hypothetical protein
LALLLFVPSNLNLVGVKGMKEKRERERRKRKEKEI